jgi:hypothetical protein
VLVFSGEQTALNLGIQEEIYLLILPGGGGALEVVKG